MVLAVALLTLLTQDPYVVEGRVVDGAGEPRVDALVKAQYGLESSSARSGEDGRFRFAFQDQPHGYARYVVASGAGATPTLRGFTPSDMEDRHHDLGDLILDRPGTLAVRVVDAEGEVQLLGSVLCRFKGLEELDKSALNRVPTLQGEERLDAGTGEVRFRSLPAGDYTLTVSQGPSGSSWDFEVTVEPDIESFFEARLPVIVGGEALLLVDAAPFTVSLEEEHLRLSAAGDRVPTHFAPESALRARRSLPRRLRLDPGGHRLEVDHPRFALQQPLIVERGDEVPLRLVPRGAVTVRLEPPAGAVAPAEPSVRALERGGPHLWVDLPRLPSGAFALPPGEWLLEVTAAPYPARWVSIELETDESAEVPVSLALARSAWLRLVDGPDRAPLGQATALLRRGPAWRGAEWESLEVGADGLVHLGRVSPEAYTLALAWGSWLRVEHLLVDPTVEDLRVETPRAGALEASLAVPDGVDRARVDLLVDGKPAERKGEGFFVDRLLAGPAQLAVSIDGGEPSPFPGEVLVPAGGTARPEVRLGSERFTGAILRIRVDGRIARGAGVLLIPDGEPSPLARRRTDSGGWVNLAGTRPGSYRLAVASVDGSWVWESPLPVALTVASVRGWTVDVPMVTRRLRVIGADGAPYARGRLAHATGRAPYEALGAVRTSGTGVVTVTLPAGPVRLGLGEVDDALELDWADPDLPDVVNFAERE